MVVTGFANAQEAAMPTFGKEQIYMMIQMQMENPQYIQYVAKCTGKSENETKKILKESLDECWNLVPDNLNQATSGQDMTQFSLCYGAQLQKGFGVAADDMEDCPEPAFEGW